MIHEEALPREPSSARAWEVPAPAELVVGDGGDPSAGELPGDLVGILPPEHAWPGNALVWMMYAGGGASLLWTVYLLLTATDLFRPTDLLKMVPMSLFPGALMVWLGRMIQQFRLVGWGVAILFLLWSLLSSLVVMGRAMDVWTIGLSMLAAGASVLWIAYLWTHRGDFS